MSLFITIAFSAFAMAAASASASASAPAPAPAAQAQAQAPSAAPSSDESADAATIDIVAKQLCKAQPVIGTRIPIKRKCETPAQLAQFQHQARELIEEYKRRPCMAGVESGNNKLMPC